MSKSKSDPISVRRKLVAAVVQAQVAGDLRVEVHAVLDAQRRAHPRAPQARVGCSSKLCDWLFEKVFPGQLFIFISYLVNPFLSPLIARDQRLALGDPRMRSAHREELVSTVRQVVACNS